MEQASASAERTRTETIIRWVGQDILAGDVVIHVAAIQGFKVKLKITAPKRMPIEYVVDGGSLLETTQVKRDERGWSVRVPRERLP